MTPLGEGMVQASEEPGSEEPTTSLHAHHIQNHRMMNQTIKGGHRRHGVFENAFPFAKDQIGTNHHRFALVALSQERDGQLGACTRTCILFARFSSFM